MSIPSNNGEMFRIKIEDSFPSIIKNQIEISCYKEIISSLLNSNSVDFLDI